MSKSNAKRRSVKAEIKRRAIYRDMTDLERRACLLLRDIRFGHGPAKRFANSMLQQAECDKTLMEHAYEVRDCAAAVLGLGVPKPKSGRITEAQCTHLWFQIWRHREQIQNRHRSGGTSTSLVRIDDVMAEAEKRHSRVSRKPNPEIVR